MTGLPDKSEKPRDGCDERHRSFVTSLICRGKEKILQENGDCRAGEWRLCVLGAGPCNDLNLLQLVAEFNRVVLVDIDAASLAKGVAAQQLSGDPRIEVCGDLDVTGIHHRLLDIQSAGVAPPHELDDLIRLSGSATWAAMPEKVDVIASTCLLSQLVLGLAAIVGDRHRQFLELVKSVRRRHFQLMISQLKPGGIGLLIFDYVSSDTLPGLRDLAGESLLAATAAAVEQKNFFHGMNPNVIANVLMTDFSLQLEWQKQVNPWIWRTSERDYAVAAIAFRKRVSGQRTDSPGKPGDLPNSRIANPGQ